MKPTEPLKLFYMSPFIGMWAAWYHTMVILMGVAGIKPNIGMPSGDDHQ